MESLKKNFQADFELLDLSNLSKCKVATNKINKRVEATTQNLISPGQRPNQFNYYIAYNLWKHRFCDEFFFHLKYRCLELWHRSRIRQCNLFQGLLDWRYQFDKSQTSKAPFRVILKKKVIVDKTHKEEMFEYGKLPKLKAEAETMPYRCGRLRMVITLPNDVNGLDPIQSNIGCRIFESRFFIIDWITVQKFKWL